MAQVAQEQRIPRVLPPQTGAVQGIFRDPSGLGIGGVAVTLRNLDTLQTRAVVSTGDGVFRILDVPPGRYSIAAQREGFQPVEQSGIVLAAGDIFAMELTMDPVLVAPGPAPPEAPIEPPYRTLPSPAQGPPEVRPTEVIAPRASVFTPSPNRWAFDWPDYQRYGPKDEAPYVGGRWLDPFNRNKLKGDYPIFGQRTFLNVGLVSDTAVTGRKIPIPSPPTLTAKSFLARWGSSHSPRTSLFRQTCFTAMPPTVL